MKNFPTYKQLVKQNRKHKNESLDLDHLINTGKQTCIMLIVITTILIIGGIIAK
jgi:hypothetical protein